jgi:recombination DNA repair RAD52 pathway protein
MINKKILAEPLNQQVVQKKQGKFNYIEAQQAMREANRAFEYEWSYSINDMALVQNELKAKSGDANIKLNYIGYTCKVIVTVDDISREGYGFGQGTDRDLGKAHESATKEAESDALKRALRSFGDIFGLALYDKTGSKITTEDKASYQIIIDEQVKYIRKLNQTSKMDEKELCTFFMIDKLEDLKGDSYEKMINFINKRIEKIKAEKDNK